MFFKFFSRATKRLLLEAALDEIDKYSQKYHIDKALLKAIIKVESNFFLGALRYEPDLQTTTWYLKMIKDIKSKEKWHFCSYGLMQILFGTAHSLGYNKHPFGLFVPEINLKYGIKYLKSLMKRYKKIEDVISAYNQGSPEKLPNGKYKNQSYVNKVMKFYKKYKKLNFF